MRPPAYWRSAEFLSPRGPEVSSGQPVVRAKGVGRCSRLQARALVTSSARSPVAASAKMISSSSRSPIATMRGRIAAVAVGCLKKYVAREPARTACRQVQRGAGELERVGRTGKSGDKPAIAQGGDQSRKESRRSRDIKNAGRRMRHPRIIHANTCNRSIGSSAHGRFCLFDCCRRAHMHPQTVERQPEQAAFFCGAVEPVGKRKLALGCVDEESGLQDRGSCVDKWDAIAVRRGGSGGHPAPSRNRPGRCSRCCRWWGRAAAAHP